MNTSAGEWRFWSQDKRLAYVMSLLLLLLLSTKGEAECPNDRVANTPLENPNTAYNNHQDGTVTDLRVGLMWQVCTVGQVYSWVNGINTCTGSVAAASWQAALVMAESNVDSGFNNWRLPNIKELQSLQDSGCDRPSINTDMFPSIDTRHYWSSTPHVSWQEHIWALNFNGGDLYAQKKRGEYIANGSLHSDGLPLRLVRHALTP